jgi:protein-L-isoaspartate(D-aspartate) O-methyltransferase
MHCHKIKLQILLDIYLFYGNFFCHNGDSMAADKKAFLKRLKKEKISKNIIDAFDEVDRELFFETFLKDKLYQDEPLPIGLGQTSDSLMSLAKMLELMNLKKSWRVFEVGTGSGYSTAVLSLLVKEVVTIDYHEKLVKTAKERLVDNGYYNIRFYAGDASEVFGELKGNFNSMIILSACLQRPLFLLTKLKKGSSAVYPMGPAFQQRITVFTDDEIEEKGETVSNCTFHDFCTFPSMRGLYGWVDQSEGYKVGDNIGTIVDEVE